MLGLSCLLRHSRPCVEAFQDAQGPSILTRFTVGLAAARCRAARDLPEGSEGTSEDAHAGPGSSNDAAGNDVDRAVVEDSEQLRQLRKGLQLLTYLVKEVSCAVIKSCKRSSPPCTPALALQWTRLTCLGCT